MINIDCRRAPERTPHRTSPLDLLLPDEDEAGSAWTQSISKEWADELNDSRQDIYTLQDGQPVNAPR